jgi:hypothetical protein
LPQIPPKGRHAERVEGKIALWKWIESRRFNQDFRTDPDADRARAFELRFKYGKELDECVKAAFKQNMELPRLRRADAWLRPVGQSVALQHGDLFKMRRERFRGHEAAHARADHDRVLPE